MLDTYLALSQGPTLSPSIIDHINLNSDKGKKYTAQKATQVGRAGEDHWVPPRSRVVLRCSRAAMLPCSVLHENRGRGGQEDIVGISWKPRSVGHPSAVLVVTCAHQVVVYKVRVLLPCSLLGRCGWERPILYSRGSSVV